MAMLEVNNLSIQFGGLRAVDGFNTNAKMNPPLRTSDDVEAIKEGLKDGTIDCIVTDHAPHHIDEKNCDLWQGRYWQVYYYFKFIGGIGA